MKKPVPFGKYLLLERVNVGGMAEVFLAKAFGVEGFERMLAIKRILPTMVEDEEFITMFLDEARISVQLNHANVVQIHELGKHDDSFYIAMEYVSGRDLRHLTERFRKKKQLMPTPMAVFIASKMCEGLDYAHRKKDARGMDLNIVHRDVSPQNILLSYEGGVKIIDFGIAKAANRAQKTQAGILKGKFGYMSPEQVRGLPVDRRSDIFAVGVTLYEMLTGEKLFVGESDFSTLEKVRNADVLPPRQYNTSIPPGLEKVVMKALARDVEDRYQWGSDLQEDLMRFLLSDDTIFSSKALATFLKEEFAGDMIAEQRRLERFAEVSRPEHLEISGVSASAAPSLPAIAAPETHEFPEEGASDRTQIFRPEFNEPARAPEETTGKSEVHVDMWQLDGGGAGRGRRETPVERAPQSLGDSDDASATIMGLTAADIFGDQDSATMLGRPSPASGTGNDADEDEGASTVLNMKSPVVRPPPRTGPPPRARAEPEPEHDDYEGDEGDDDTPLPDDADATLAPGSLKAMPIRRTGPAADAAGGAGRKKLLIGGVAALLLVTVVVAVVVSTQPSAGQLVVVAEPVEQVTVTLDGQVVQNQSPLAVPTGVHVVGASAPGYASARQQVEVHKGVPQTVRLVLSRAEPEPAERGPARAPIDEEEPVVRADTQADPPVEEPEVTEARGAGRGELAEAAKVPAPAAARYFDLKVESDPGGAEIEINGKKFGSTPRTLKEMDPAKISSVKLSLRGYESRTEPVSWDGQRTEVAVYAVLAKKAAPAPRENAAPPAPAPRPKAPAVSKGTGQLVLASRPVAKVLLNGKDTGRWTPIAPANALKVDSGTHSVTFVAADGSKTTHKVTVGAGETVRLIGVDDFK